MIDLDALADEEAAKINPPHPCWVCSIPERAWVDKAKKDGRSVRVITAVLVKQGHSPEMATKHRVGTHLANCVR